MSFADDLMAPTAGAHRAESDVCQPQLFFDWTPRDVIEISTIIRVTQSSASFCDNLRDKYHFVLTYHVTVMRSALIHLEDQGERQAAIW
mmetsp:Transcript_134451/g.233309  ORF Transcript_134451/g.233309 Transcript_134451/m.233309 type:complete len:89 (+) Transcript_134451:1021-1287(+)